jgi:RNA polymerase sigma-70 factor, ECF subfamily
MNDQQAIRRLKAGDISGLEFLIAHYQAKALRTALLITHDEALAEDVVQETFVRIYRKIGSFDDARPFEPYLLRSVSHVALNTAEKTARWVPLEDDCGPNVIDRLMTQALMTEDVVEYAQLKQEIFRALAQLPPRERTVIIQRYYLEMSEKEMAEDLSTPPGTVKWLLNVARQRLRGLMSMERNTK